MKTFANLRYAPLLTRLPARLTDGVLSMVRPADMALRQWMHSRLSAPAGTPGSVLGDPVVEAMFRWKTADKSACDLLAEGKLHESLVSAMASDSAGDYRVHPDRRLFAHQLEALEAVRAGHSVLVSAGTGAGKTETFLYPILDDLCRQAGPAEPPLVGVQALFIYPLNALIRSQKERLLAWMEPHQGRQRFVLYNGDLVETQAEVVRRAQADKRSLPLAQVHSREELRRVPPPLLITNTTMLELMLVRPKDQSILQQSRGKLKWIVIDEAHTYTGSQAAELTLLLRRTLEAFGVEPSCVQFIATSATIGDESEASTQALRRFLADVAGTTEERISVVRGYRDVPTLAALQGTSPTLAELEAAAASSTTNPAKYMDELRRSPAALRLRDALASNGPATLTEIQSITGAACVNEAARWVDAVTAGQAAEASREQEKTSSNAAGDDRFLPTRLHVFQRTVDALWSCVNPRCQGKVASPQLATWPYGALHDEDQPACSACGSMMLEVSLCADCGAAALRGVISVDGNKVLPGAEEIDEFIVDVEASDEDKQEETGPATSDLDRDCLLIAPRLLAADTGFAVSFNARSGEIASGDDVEFVALRWVAPDPTGAAGETIVGHGACQSCATSVADIDRSRRPIRLSAPFSLSNAIPELLASAPPDPRAVGDAVLMEGRRLLTFADSRQGAARGAARLYDTALRDYVRYVVPQLLPGTLDAGRRADLESARGRLAAEIASPGADVVALAGKIAEISKQLDGPYGISWPKVCENLAAIPEVRGAIATYFSELAGVRKQPEDVAHLLLLRELYRRPKRTNALETLGLVSLSYPAVQKITAASVPQAWAELGGSLEEWRSYLKLYIDFYIRENGCVELTADESDWIGTRFRRKFLVLDAVRSPQKIRWLQVQPGAQAGRRPRLVKLLETCFPGVTAGQLGEILDAARVTLTGAHDLFGSTGGANAPEHYLKWRGVELERPKALWLCPVTRRLLDTTLRGISPYDRGDGRPQACVPIRLPVAPAPFWEHGGRYVDPSVREAWLAEAKATSVLVERGLWPEALDRALIGAPFFSAIEHTAQIDQSRLDRLTAQFQAGRVNVLNCSTTMEMGVDIGNLSVVAMANPPPALANYLQRAGRAGRRDETRAVAYTVCPPDPRATEILRQPQAFMRSVIEPPHVRLDSPVIVQRHLQAWMLREFVRAESESGNVLELQVGPFFGVDDVESLVDAARPFPPESGPRVRFLQFIDELAHSADAVNRASRILSRSTLATVPLQELAEVARHNLESSARRLFEELGGLRGQLQTLPASATPARAAIGSRIRRFLGEKLFTFLTEQGFLPTRGFPTDVRELVIASRYRDEHNDEKLRKASLSRELPVALREYQPGSDVVVGGAVYTVGGLTMNWQRPAGEGSLSEIQNIRWRLLCGACGEVTDSAAKIEACRACDADAQADCNRRFEYLVPGGFVVPVDHAPNDAIAQPRYVPSAPPKFAMRTQDGQPAVRRLLHNHAGWFRTASAAEVYHHTLGIDERGFDVCLGCGRAGAGGEVKPAHDHPFTGRSCRASNENPWLLKHFGALAATSRTNALEYMLAPKADGLPLRDRTVATTLAVLLRKVAAKRLAINEQELGYAVQQTLVRGAQGISIIVYDKASGGCGYTTALDGEAEALLQQAIGAAASCANASCKGACPSCLLSHETKRDADYLNRNAVLALLGQGFGKTLQVPASAREWLGEGARWETRGLRDAVLATLAAQPASRVTLFDCSETATGEASKTMALLYRAQATHPSVRRALVVSADRFEADPIFARRLSVLKEAGVLDDVGLAADTAQSLYRTAAQVECRDGIASWVAEEGTELLLAGAREEDVRWLTPEELALNAEGGGNAWFFEIAPHAPQQPRQFFEANFLSELRQWNPDLPRMFAEDVERIEYSDRFVRRRGCAGVMAAIVSGLVGQTSGQQRDVTITSLSMLDRPGSAGYADWSSDAERQRDLSRALDGFRLTFCVVPKQMAPHQRALKVYFNDGRVLRLLLDPGVDYWETTRSLAIAPTSANVRNKERQIVMARFDS